MENQINKLMNIFKKEKEVAILQEKSQQSQQNEIIAEIHKSFYEEVDRLLAEAKILHPLDSDKQQLIEKSKRLSALGFTSAKEVKDAETENLRLANLQLENEKKTSLVEAINYFSFKYPQYKFITEESVKVICKKYNLVYGEISNYIGVVPDEHLKKIEDFKIDADDYCYEMSDWGIKTYLDFHTYQKSNKNVGKIPETPEMFYYSSMRTLAETQLGVSYAPRKSQFEMVAPPTDFNMNNMQIKDFKVSQKPIPDPVVLCPVFYDNQKYYLIITAWGQEASDELVANERNN